MKKYRPLKLTLSGQRNKNVFIVPLFFKKKVRKAKYSL
jgi:hypothetical protein